jgi:hypothetical protein
MQTNRRCRRHAAGHWLWAAASVLALTSAAGCGGSRTFPAQGRVVFKDGADIHPLAGGLVVFEPLDPGAKDSARGEIRPDGTFRLGTYKEADGAPPGRYRALVSPPPLPPTEEGRPGRPAIHPRYQSVASSPLEFDVARGPNQFTLTVEKP